MLTLAIKNKDTGATRIGTAIRVCDLKEPHERILVDNKPMKMIWKQKIDEIQEKINEANIGYTFTLTKLFKIKDNLQIAFNRCD